MIRFVRAAALAAIAILTLSVGALLGTGTAYAEATLKATGGPGTITVEVTGGPAKADCLVRTQTKPGSTDFAGREVTLDDKGNVKTVLVRGTAGKYKVNLQCEGVNKSAEATVTAVPPNQCVQIVHDIAWGFGLRGNELAVVMNIARQYCPR